MLSIIFHISKCQLNLVSFYIDRVSVGRRCARGASSGKRSCDEISTFKKMLYISNKLSNLQVQSLQSNKGIWRDEVDPTHPLYTGPIWLEAYPAPLETLPYFTRASPLQ
jgi:hypothetical protein